MLKWDLDEVDSLQQAQDDAFRQALRQAQSAAQDDALPENTPYRDEGCELFPRCLRCPFPVCRHDDPEWHLKRKADRNAQIRRRRRQGLSIAELAEHFGVSKRTVHRALAGDAPGDGPSYQFPVAPRKGPG